MRIEIYTGFIFTLFFSVLGYSQLNSSSYSSGICSTSPEFDFAALSGYEPQLTSTFINSNTIITTQIDAFIDPSNELFAMFAWDDVETVGFYLKSVNPDNLCDVGPGVYDMSFVQSNSFSSFNLGITITNLNPGACYRIYTGVKYVSDPDMYFSEGSLIIYTAPTLNSYAQSQSYCSSSAPLFSSLASVNSSNIAQFPNRSYSINMYDSNDNLVTLSSIASSGTYTVQPRVEFEDGTTVDGVIGTISVQITAQPLFLNPISSFVVAHNNKEFTLNYSGSPTNFYGYRRSTPITTFNSTVANKLYYSSSSISSAPLSILPIHTNTQFALAPIVTQSQLDGNLQPVASNYFHTYRLSNQECGFQNTTVQVFRLPTPNITGYSTQTVCSQTQINQLSNPGTVTIGSKNYTWAFFPDATTTTPFTGTDIAQSTSYVVRYKLTENGTDYYSDTYATVNVTVVSPTAGSISAPSPSTICSGAQPGEITSLTSGTSSAGIVSYEWQTGLTTISGATTSTYTPGVLTATSSYQRRTVATSGSTVCYSDFTSPITIIVSAAPLGGTVSGTQTICSGSTPSQIHLSGHSGSIQWQSSTDNVTFANISGQTEPIVTTGSLTTTTYYRAIVTQGTCPSTSTVGIVTVNSTGTWIGGSTTITPAAYNTAANWCGGSVPTSPTIPPGVTVYMDGSYDFTNVTVECGGSLIITETGRVNITNVLTNGGLVHVINGGTIHYGSTVSGTCTGTYEITETFSPSRFWYVGPTTTNTTRAAFGSVASSANPTGTQMWSWNEPQNNTANNYIAPVYQNGNLIPGNGYVYRNLGATTLEVNVTGPYITSAISRTGLTRTGTGTLAGYHLLSNPYTAYLDLTEVLAAANTGTSNMLPTVWVRSNSSSNGNAASMVFDTYNAQSGIGTGLGWQTAALNGNPGGINSLMRWVAPMQGFWVRVNTGGSTGNVAFDYSMASANPIGAGQLRTTSPIEALARINVQFGDQKDQFIAALSPSAQNGFDTYDSEKMFTSGVVQAYAPNSGKKLVINTVKNNKSKISMPLTVECPGNGWYSFELLELQLEAGVLLLEDKLEGVMHDLTVDTSYQFYANSGVLSNRFVLHFNLPLATANPSGPSSLDDLVSESQNAQIEINSTSTGKVSVELTQVDENTSSFVRVVDINGKVLESFYSDGSSFDFQIGQGQGVYIIEVSNGLTVEKKKVFIQ